MVNQRRRASIGAVCMTLAVGLAACSTDQPKPGSTTPAPQLSATGTAPPTSGPTATTAPTAPTTSAPSTNPAPASKFPLAVVTGVTNLKANVSVADVTALAKAGNLTWPCGVTVSEPAVTPAGACTPADQIPALLQKNPTRVALLPPGLVEPATKVLSITGSGPYGMFGADLFGDTEARKLPYPITATPAPGGPALEASWTAYDPGQVWTMTNVGSLCSDRGAAIAATTPGKGWKWVFNGGTAKYAAPSVVDPPRDPPRTVRPIDTGNAGATPAVLKRSDVAIADHECPIVPDAKWKPQTGTVTVFSVPEAVLPYWRDTMGLDMVYLAANHMSDKGNSGIKSTLELMDKAKVKRTGMGMNLDEALEPGYVDVAGLKVGFVAFNDVAGVARADANTPGVPWITKENIVEGVKRAKAGGADLVVCNPQWWGGAEYHDDLFPTQKKQLQWFQESGCDHVIGSGTHVAGPVLLTPLRDSISVTLASPGNYLFGQGWWQKTQEGVILDLSFRGKELVNVRLRPTVMIQQAKPALLDPEVDGQYVLKRTWKNSTVNYLK